MAKIFEWPAKDFIVSFLACKQHNDEEEEDLKKVMVLIS